MADELPTTYPDLTELGLKLLHRLDTVVDASKANALSTTELGAKAAEDNALRVRHLVPLRTAATQ